MKKVLAVVMIAAVVGVAGVAAARQREWGRRADGRDGFCRCGAMQGHERGFRNDDRRDGKAGEKREWKRGDRRPADCRRGMERGRRGGMPGGEKRQGSMPMGPMSRDGMAMMRNAPDDIRAGMNELAKLRIDMREALTRDPIDRAKAVEIHGKMASLMQEIGTWRFNRRLDDIERRRKEMELNKKVPMGAPSSTVSGDSAPHAH